MTTFLALYRGNSVSAAKLLALTAEPELVRHFAARMLAEPGEQEPDPVLQQLEEGQRGALRQVQSGASG
jgi:HEAT repeat protein